MNALWLTRISAYKNSKFCLESAQKIISIKVERQATLLKKYRRQLARFSLETPSSFTDLFLREARISQSFWSEFKKLLPIGCDFPGRKAGGADVPNRLLDVGYHHLTNIVRKILEEHDISAALGVLHVARTSKSAPLAYDLVELFRSDIVDAEVLRFLRLKKKKLIRIEENIPHFLYEINERLKKKYYLKDFKTCHTYRYYMEVQILKFQKAVNHRRVFEPVYLPLRHEHRCA